MGDNTNRNTPVIVTGLTGVKQLAMGKGFMFALMNDGTVKAWGSNGHGQLGLGDNTNRNTPAIITNLIGVKQLSGSEYHTLILMEDGSIRTCGLNDEGQLGLGDLISRNIPTTIPGLNINTVSDTQMPTVPSNLITLSVTTTSVDLMWDSASDNVGVEGYKIYRNGAEIGTSSTLDYTDTGLTAGTTYIYTVKAYDAVGNLSDASNELSVTTDNPRDTEAPTAPKNLINLGVTTNSVDLMWDNATDNIGVAGYRIYRNGTEIGTSSTLEYSDNGLDPETTYTYTIKAYDDAGNLSDFSDPLVITTNTAPDTEAPSIPEGLLSLGVTSSSVDFMWDNSTDNVGVVGYRIYRNGTEIGTSSTSEYSDNGLDPETTYTYTIKAYDNTGNLSDFSDPLVITTNIAPDTEAPSIPEGLLSLGVTSSSVDLMWDNSTDNIGVAGYRIYRDGTEIGTSSTPEYSDNGLNPETTYKYAVKAYDDAGNLSDFSDLLVISTDAAPDTEAPSIPEGLLSLGVTSSSADIIWDNSTDNVGVAGYIIYRDGEEIGTSSTPEYSDDGLYPETTYTYTVKAYDDAGNLSDFSDPIVITTDG